MAETEQRIGILNEDNTVKTWPNLDVLNGHYDRTQANRQGIGGDKFVVLPVGFNQWELIGELKGQHNPAPMVTEEAVEPSEDSGLSRRRRGGE